MGPGLKVRLCGEGDEKLRVAGDEGGGLLNSRGMSGRGRLGVEGSIFSFPLQPFLSVRSVFNPLRVEIALLL